MLGSDKKLWHLEGLKQTRCFNFAIKNKSLLFFKEFCREQRTHSFQKTFRINIPRFKSSWEKVKFLYKLESFPVQIEGTLLWRRVWFQLEGDEKEEKSGKEELKDIGNLPSRAGVCQTTDNTGVLHTPGKQSPAWAGPRSNEITNQPYLCKHAAEEWLIVLESMCGFPNLSSCANINVGFKSV